MKEQRCEILCMKQELLDQTRLTSPQATSGELITRARVHQTIDVLLAIIVSDDDTLGNPVNKQCRQICR